MDTNNRCSVLVVEDDPSTAQFVESALSDEGYNVRIVSNGAEALRQVEEAPPAVILLDLLLPVMGGASFLNELRRRYPEGIAVILMTATREGMEEAETTGAEGLLLKPFELDDLLAEVRRLTGEAVCPR